MARYTLCATLFCVFTVVPMCGPRVRCVALGHEFSVHEGAGVGSSEGIHREGGLKRTEPLLHNVVECFVLACGQKLRVIPEQICMVGDKLKMTYALAIRAKLALYSHFRD